MDRRLSAIMIADDTLELYKDSVAHRLDKAAVVFGDVGFENILEIGLEACARIFFVELGSSGPIADDLVLELEHIGPSPRRSVRPDMAAGLARRSAGHSGGCRRPPTVAPSRI